MTDPYDLSLITDEQSLYRSINAILENVPVVRADLVPQSTAMVVIIKIEPALTQAEMDGYKKDALDTAFLTVVSEAHRGGYTRILWRRAPRWEPEADKLLLRFRYLLLLPEAPMDSDLKLGE
jgi:hypothetical protein